MQINAVNQQYDVKSIVIKEFEQISCDAASTWYESDERAILPKIDENPPAIPDITIVIIDIIK